MAQRLMGALSQAASMVKMPENSLRQDIRLIIYQTDRLSGVCSMFCRSVGILTLLTLSACSDGNLFDVAAGTDHQARYAGAGTYPAGDKWRAISQPESNKHPDQASIADDEQVIVILDARTGEYRQCGNLSGYCISKNPWAAGTTPTASLPARIDREKANQDNPNVKDSETIS